jgi:hypothetical protein
MLLSTIIFRKTNQSVDKKENKVLKVSSCILMKITESMYIRRQFTRFSFVTKTSRTVKMAQVVSRWTLKAEARVLARGSPYRICGGQSGTEIDILRVFSVFFCQYHSAVALHTHT